MRREWCFVEMEAAKLEWLTVIVEVWKKFQAVQIAV
jgi:hypothetical protein